jgi:predicted RNase H-like nuclease (RuvC/YqgF family)
MVNYTCPTCNKEFKQKQHYIEHTQKRKKPCQIVLHKFAENCTNLQNFAVIIENIENTCEYCEKNFSSIYTLNRHLSNYCKIKKSIDDENQKQNDQIAELKQLILNQAKQIEDLKNKTTNITINNTDNSVKNNVNNVNNINLMAHGSEDLSKIETKTILKYLCSDKFESIVPNIAKEIFRNKDRHLTAQLASTRCCLADLNF